MGPKALVRMVSLFITVVLALLWNCGLVIAEDESRPSALEFRQIVDNSLAQTGTPIPADAVQVFVYEGAPRGERVTDRYISIDYGNSFVLFDRRGGSFVRRLAIAQERPPDFPVPHGQHSDMVGPGVLYVQRGARQEVPEYEVAASVEFAGYVWKAMQPTGFLNGLNRRVDGDYRKMREIYGSWTGILRTLNAESFLQAEPLDGRGRPVRHTMNEGLAGNIVTHLAVADGKLWAACVDIYDPEKERWGPGGLCTYDPRSRRWQKVDRIHSRSVRWVTLLEKTDKTLWVGFREASGIAGDKVVYGMGLYLGCYRPQASAIVLARLADGKWTTFLRGPLPDGDRDGASSTETSRSLALLGGSVFLYSETFARASGNWRVDMTGHISLLDPAEGAWRIFGAEQDFGAHVLDSMILENGELLAFTDRGAHRWSEDKQAWTFLDPQSPVRNANVSAAVTVGNELWIGYTNQSFGVIGHQGISCYNEKTGTWSYMTPEQIGTAAPVRQILPMLDGDVWVLFRGRQSFSARAEIPYYPEESRNAPRGVGRFTKGKWEFPAQLDGVPASRERTRQRPDGVDTWREKLPILDIARIGDRLFVANRAAVYVGPGQWSPVLEGDILGIQPSEDGKSLVVHREYKDTSSENSRPEMQRGLYDPETGNVTFSAIEFSDYHRSLQEGGHLLGFRRHTSWSSSWTRVPTRKEGVWAVGPLGSGSHTVVETPWSVWIASRGELIRLDRQKLQEWLGSNRD